MPFWIQCIDVGAGLIGFIITLITLLTTCSVKKQIIHNAEREIFKQEVAGVIGKVDGFINSINEDKIYVPDNNRSFKPALSQFLTDVKTRFTFLSKDSAKLLAVLHKKLDNPNLTENDWGIIAEQLIALKNTLQKEALYHG